MKNVVLMLMLIFAVSAAKAQMPSRSDSNHIEHPPQRPDPAPATGSQPQLNPDINQSVDPLIRVRIDAIPAAMRKALETDKYRGWQKSGVYMDSKSSEYVIDIRSGDSTQHFDLTNLACRLNQLLLITALRYNHNFRAGIEFFWSQQGFEHVQKQDNTAAYSYTRSVKNADDVISIHDSYRL